MRVLLMDPPGPWLGFNHGLAYLCSSLEGKHIIKVLEFAVPRSRSQSVMDVILQTINSFSPQVIGVSIASATWQVSREIVNEIRSRAPDMFIAVGGAHATISQENLLSCQAIDAVVIGEGEYTLPDLLDNLEGDLSQVKGIAFRDGDRIIKTERRAWIQNLDDLPFPDYRYLGLTNRDPYPLITSRGCPGRCIFCSVGIVSGKKFRKRSPENIVAELEMARVRYGINNFLIDDDCFSMDMKRAKDFCGLLVEKELNMEWSCNNGIRADRLDSELAHKMKKAGCVRVSIGIESPIPEILRNIKKGESLEDIQKAIRILKKAGLKTRGSFIVGLPSDNPERAKRAVAIAKGFKLDVVTYNNLIPYPGTEIESWVEQHGKILRDYEESAQHMPEPRPVFETPDFSEAERIEAYERANIKFKNYHPFYLRKFRSEQTRVGNGDSAKPSELPFQPHSLRVRAGIWLRILALIIRYDFLNLPSHAYTIGKAFLQLRLRRSKSLN